MSRLRFILIFGVIYVASPSLADKISPHMADCGAMEGFDLQMQMCMPLPMAEMSMKMLMLHGNSFFTGITESGSRGRTAFAVPNFIMADLGATVGANQYINLDYMGTLERWTLPDSGYPELLQVGEENNQGTPYLDAQHPHSSPVMGLTLSDLITFGNRKNYVKVFAAPRGEATDGPIAFMHRPTGVVNPDAPLGHHIGQDVGHITSTVIGLSLSVGDTRFEFSTYHGAEPKPQSVDLPLGSLDSYSFRLSEIFSSQFVVMGSYGYVTNPELDMPSVAFENRYSASVYDFFRVTDKWQVSNTVIWGTVSNYDGAATLTSFAEEFLLSHDICKYWSRLEVLQRTPNELQIQTINDPNVGQWVGAFTVGYTHRLVTYSDATELGLGGSVTTDFLPQDYQGAYSGNPWTGKIFLQLSAMKMWNL